MKDKEWGKFLNWLYKAHALTYDWKPERISIELWLEYKVNKIGENTTRKIR